jgi:hypothetical protein
MILKPGLAFAAAVIAVGSLTLSVPTEAISDGGMSAAFEAAPGWHKIGTYVLPRCLEMKTYYHNHFGTIAERCDAVGNGFYDLWVRTDG